MLLIISLVGKAGIYKKLVVAVSSVLMLPGPDLFFLEQDEWSFECCYLYDVMIHYLHATCTIIIALYLLELVLQLVVLLSPNPNFLDLRRSTCYEDLILVYLSLI